MSVADLSRDTNTPSEAYLPAGDSETGPVGPTEHLIETDLEEVLLLDEIVEAVDAEPDLDTVEPWRAPEVAASAEGTIMGLDLDDIASAVTSDAVDEGKMNAALGVEPVDADEASAVPEFEPPNADEVITILDAEVAAIREPEADEEPWDALGEALQQAVARANPPLAEDLVRSAEPSNHVLIEELLEMAPAAGPSYDLREVGEADADTAAPVDKPGRAKRPADDLSEDLAATLESLASKLRTRGFNGLDDAFTRGGRLESSLALFLAGYRAGLDE